MRNQKYELVLDDTIQVRGETLHRIKALRSFADVTKGELGGYIKDGRNLEHECAYGVWYLQCAWNEDYKATCIRDSTSNYDIVGMWASED